jgi:hypothetical protein
MGRLLLALVLVVAASGVAAALRRRRPAPPTQARYQVPTQLDRADFAGLDRGWLVAVFTSQTCESCARVWAKVEVLASAAVAVQDVSYQAHKALHERYAVEAVPCILVADEEGVVRASFIGVPTATDLWAAVAEARAPGSSPEPDIGRAP